MSKKSVAVFIVLLVLVAVGAWQGGRFQAQHSAKADLEGMSALAALTAGDPGLTLVGNDGMTRYAASSSWNSSNIIATSNERYLYLIRAGSVYQFDAKSLKFIDARTLPNYKPRSLEDEDRYSDDDRDLPWPWN